MVARLGAADVTITLAQQEQLARHWRHRQIRLTMYSELIYSFAKRELLGRYKGSALGIAWAVLTPVVMIAIFTFIFAGIFGARFGASDSHWDYALYLFCGLLPWTMFQESVQQSANTIIIHANLVKRVVFPLETLPAAQVFAALGNQLFATVALLDRDARDPARVATDRAVVAGAFDPAIDVRARRRVVDRVARRFSTRHRAGNHVVADGVDVPDADHLSRIDRARTFSSVDKRSIRSHHSCAAIDASSSTGGA